MDNNNSTIGSWHIPNYDDSSQYLHCVVGSGQGGVTHSSLSTSRYQLYLQWKPSHNYHGPVTIMATIVINYSTYWTKITSNLISVDKDSPDQGIVISEPPYILDSQGQDNKDSLYVGNIHADNIDEIHTEEAVMKIPNDILIDPEIRKPLSEGPGEEIVHEESIIIENRDKAPRMQEFEVTEMYRSVLITQKNSHSKDKNNETTQKNENSSNYSYWWRNEAYMNTKQQFEEPIRKNSSHKSVLLMPKKKRNDLQNKENLTTIQHLTVKPTASIDVMNVNIEKTSNAQEPILERSDKEEILLTEAGKGKGLEPNNYYPFNLNPTQATRVKEMSGVTNRRTTKNNKQLFQNIELNRTTKAPTYLTRIRNKERKGEDSTGTPMIESSSSPGFASKESNLGQDTTSQNDSIKNNVISMTTMTVTEIMNFSEVKSRRILTHKDQNAKNYAPTTSLPKEVTELIDEGKQIKDKKEEERANTAKIVSKEANIEEKTTSNDFDMVNAITTSKTIKGEIVSIGNSVPNSSETAVTNSLQIPINTSPKITVKITDISEDPNHIKLNNAEKKTMINYLSPTEIFEEQLGRIIMTTDPSSDNNITTVQSNDNDNVQEVSRQKAARSDDETSYKRMNAEYGAWERNSGIEYNRGYGSVVFIVCLLQLQTLI